MSSRDAPQDGYKHSPYIVSDTNRPQHGSQADEERHEGGTRSSDSNSKIPEHLGERQSPRSHNLSPYNDRSPEVRNPRLQIPGSPSLGSLAMAAIQCMPHPMMVLDNQKTLVMANEAMGRLLDVDNHSATNRDETSVVEKLWGKTLSQIGIDVLRNERPVCVIWDSFLDSIAHEQDPTEGATHKKEEGVEAEKEQGHTGSSEIGEPLRETISKSSSAAHDTVIEVVISPGDVSGGAFQADKENKAAPLHHSYAKMIISVWEMDGQRYFTLTFTNTDTHQGPMPPSGQPASRPKMRRAHDSTELLSDSGVPSSIYKQASIYRRASIANAVKNLEDLGTSEGPFPPLAPPSQSAGASASSSLQKLFVMKDALLDCTEVPLVAMWKDYGLTISNRAARNLFSKEAGMTEVKDGFELVLHWNAWDEGFTTKLEASQYPLIELITTEKAFRSRKIGLIDAEGRRRILDCSGEPIRDEATGEFLAGMVTAKDITDVTKQIRDIAEKNEQRFQVICDSMPQMIWTTTAEGEWDWFSQRWYEYTGLTEEESLGLAWQSCFHPDDLKEAMQLWDISVKEGIPYSAEVRCRNRDGQYRWMLTRALPLRNMDTGNVERWFGTSTDIQEMVETRSTAKRLRQQLLYVIAHAQVTLFSVDKNCNLTLVEGAFIWDPPDGDTSLDENARFVQGEKFIGQNLREVLSSRWKRDREDQVELFLQPVEDILSGKSTEQVYEGKIDNRWFRTKFVRVLGRKDPTTRDSETVIDGVIGVSMDVTEIKEKEMSLRAQERENTRLQANETAANEASRLKGQFLANMSHEIRTPIAGIIGMAEIIADTELDEEQRECADNIQRSASALLTVINDILDFSKVESGRLDIEEVRFSLSIVVQDVSKMLRFAAEKKDLLFESDICVSAGEELVVMGDPGRLRQIITNLITNSIKFTNEGRVKFLVQKEKETDDTIEIKFLVEDTGIGIDEENQKRLFKPFSQADPSTARRFGGTGLGLTICKNLVHLMNGRIELTSSPGHGTSAVFWIPFKKPQDTAGDLVDIGSLPERLQSERSLPYSESEHSTDSPTQPSFQQATVSRTRSSSSSSIAVESQLSREERSKINILLVEDNAINQTIALRAIRKLGYSVTAVWNGREALDYLVASGPSPSSSPGDTPAPADGDTHPFPDTILMDVQMPVIDGYRATHLIRHHTPYREVSGRIPIIAMTASAIQGDREKCMRAGMDDYIAKPVRGRTLEKALDRWTVEGRGRREGGEFGVKADENHDQPYAESECTEGSTGEHECNSRKASSGASSSAQAASHSDALTVPDPDVVNAQREDSEIAEEKTLGLELDQLAQAAGQGGKEDLGPCATALTEGQELTEENIGKLEQESSDGGGGGARGSGSEVGSDAVDIGERSDVDSQPSGSAGVGDAQRPRRKSSRPQVQRFPDSQKTITGL